MNTQHRITSRRRLLDESGSLTEPGYATSLLLEYRRKDIKAAGYRIKEWDYYYIGNRDNAVALTIADNSYISLISATVFDFNERSELTKTLLIPFTFGRLKMPEDSRYGTTAFENSRTSVSFVNDGEKRKIFCDFKKFNGTDNLLADITLTDEPRDTMVIATPFAGDKKAFYYNQKINNLRAKGKVLLGRREYSFDTPDSMGTLDWGRGVWTYRNTWYWGSMSVLLEDGTPFGFNIGYGFGDTGASTENMLFYNGTAHKLSRVDFIIPSRNGKDDFMSPWRFTSDDGRFELDFIPILDRYSKSDIILLKSVQHQVFGRFSGKVILDDGRIIEIRDKTGFAEKVYNRF